MHQSKTKICLKFQRLLINRIFVICEIEFLGVEYEYSRFDSTRAS